MSTRRKKFTASMHFEPGGAEIQEIFCSVATRIQGAIPTETPCTIRVTAIVTMDPTPAEIRKHTSPIQTEHYQDDPILNETSASKFRVGQRVIYTSNAREQVGLSREVEAVIEEVHYSIINTRDSPPVYTISWPPTGRTTVNKRDINALPPGEEQT